MNNVLYEACRLSEEEWINSFFPLEEHVFSARHERKMKVLFSKIRNNKYHKLTKNAVRAIIIAAIILSLAITAFAIEIVKAYKTYNLQVGTFYKASINYNIKIEEDLSVKYLPDGYNLVKEYNGYHFLSKTFESKNGDIIIIDKFILGNEAVFNTEPYPYDEIFNNGIKYLYYYYQGQNCIIWNNGDYTYNITSNLSKDDLISVALSTE